MVTRRAVILGAVGGVTALALGAGAASFAGLLPGRSTLYRVLGLNGEAGTIPDAAPGPYVEGAFVSERRLGVETGYGISYPPGAEPGDLLPVLVALHGLGGDFRTPFVRLGLDRFLAAAVADGAPPFAIAAVDGGESYWHPREDASDAGAMVVEELLPLLAEQGLAIERIALCGWSMGGYGALRLAGVLGPDRVAAVAASSPALWASFADAPAVAFDSLDQFARDGLVGAQAELDGIPTWIDCGEGDGFAPVVRAYRDGFAEEPLGGLSAGGHDMDFWRRVAPAQVAFLGEALAG